MKASKEEAYLLDTAMSLGYGCIVDKKRHEHGSVHYQQELSCMYDAILYA
jgi:hypothetical protein